MNLIVMRPEELNREINEFERSKNKIQEIFERERRSMLVLNNGHSWVGKAAETMVSKQELFQKNFDPVIEALETFIRFMKESLEEYKRAEKETMRYISENEEELDVNS